MTGLFPEPHSGEMVGTVLWYGNAVVPYRIVATEHFHTEFAARLFGQLSCWPSQYYHWVLVWPASGRKSFPQWDEA